MRWRLTETEAEEKKTKQNREPEIHQDGEHRERWRYTYQSKQRPRGRQARGKTGNLIAREKERRKGRWGRDRATKGEFNRKRDRMQKRQKQRKVRSKGTVQK